MYWRLYECGLAASQRYDGRRKESIPIRRRQFPNPPTRLPSTQLHDVASKLLNPGRPFVHCLDFVDFFACEVDEELVARGYKPPVRMQTQGAAVEMIRAALAAKDLDFEFTGDAAPPNGEHYVEAVFTVSEPEFRVVTKVALNYLTAMTAPELVLMPQFDLARRFARYGEKPPKRIVHARPNRRGFLNEGGDPVIGHYLSVHEVDNEIVAQVCLLNSIRYLITLARGVLLPSALRALLRSASEDDPGDYAYPCRTSRPR